MPLSHRGRLAARIATAAAGAAAMLLASSGVALAGYGPGGGSGPKPPGGFGCVVTSQTVGPAGRSIGPLSLGSLTVTIRIPPGALSKPTQITVTEPFGQSGSCRTGPGLGGTGPGLRDLQAVGGVGILLQRSGSKGAITVKHPITISISSRQITAKSVIEVYTGGRFTKDPGATVSPGFAQVSTFTSADFLVMSPSRGYLGHAAAGRSGTSRPAHRGATTAARGAAISLVAQARLLPRGSQATGLGVLTVRSATGTTDARSASAIRG